MTKYIKHANIINYIVFLFTIYSQWTEVDRKVIPFLFAIECIIKINKNKCHALNI